MDFHGMKRKDLQILCKKHGIPANLKNVEMANRLASLLEKEEEEIVTETKVSPEDDGIVKEEENLVANRKAKKVRFSPETDNQIFEFTRSVKNVRTRRRRQSGDAKALQEGGDRELRRSTRSESKEITLAGSNGEVLYSMSEIVEAEKGPSSSVKVTRRSMRIASSGSTQEEGKDTDRDVIDVQGGRRSTRLAAKTEKSLEEGGTSKPVALLPASKRSKVLVDEKVTEEANKKKDGDSKVEMVCRRSMRFVNEQTDTQDRRRSVGLKASAADPLIGSSGSIQDEGKDTDLIAREQFEDKDIQDRRQSMRLAAQIERSFEEGGASKSVALLPAAKRSKRIGSSGGTQDEGKDTNLTAPERFVGKDIYVENSTRDRRRPVRLKATVANPLMGQAVKAARVAKGTLVDKKTDGNLIKSSKRVTRNMKRDRSADPEMDRGTATNQRNLSPETTLDELVHFEQEEACGADVEAGGTSKKSKTLNQECIKDKPQGIITIEESPSSSETKAAVSVMIVEKVFDPILDKSVDSSQRSNARELNCEPVEGECEEKLELDTVSMPVMEDEKEEVSSRSLSSPKDKLHVPTGHIIVKDIASTVIVEENSTTKDVPLVRAPDSQLKEHSSIAKLANVEGILENSTECWKEIHSSNDDEKDSLDKDVQEENLHENASECNTENNNADEEMETNKEGGMGVSHCVNITPEKLLCEYIHLEQEEAERLNVEARRSSQKMKKTVGQEFVKDKPQGMADDSPCTSETKATEPVVISENVLKISHELVSELLKETFEEKHEQATVSVVAAKKDKEEALSVGEFLIECSEVKACPDNNGTGCSLSVETTVSPASVQLPMSKPGIDLGMTIDNDIASTVITEEDNITMDETVIFGPTTEIKKHSSVAKLAQVQAILGNSAEFYKDDERGSLEKDVQAENLHVNFSECSTEKSSSEEEMEISKVGFMSADLCVNLTPENLLDAYPQLVLEEAVGPNVETGSSSKKVKSVSSECLKENPQEMADDSPSTSVTKTAETMMMSKNVLDSTSKVSVDISLVRNTQEFNSELTYEEREEKQDQDIVLVTETKKDKEKASSPSELVIRRPEVSIPESELFMETTPPPSVQLAVSNPESELSVPTTGDLLAKDIVSEIIAEEDIKIEEVPKSVHSFAAKLAETDAVVENSAECWNESLSSKDDDRSSLEKEKQSAKRHGNFCEYNAENNSAEEQADICKVGRISDGHYVDRETLDEVKDDSLMKPVQTISSERGCKPNALELSGSLSTDFASFSPKEVNVSECLEQDEMKALSQPTPINKAASNTFDMSSVFTTPERNMLMEQLSESGKIVAADIVTQNNDEARESHGVVFTTPEQLLLLGDSGLDEVEKKEEQTATGFPNESDVPNTSQNEVFNEGERIVVELHDESNIKPAGDFQEDRTERREENRTVELHCESGTGPVKPAALVNSVSDGAESSGGNKAMEFYEESVDFTGLKERHELFGYSEQDKAREGEATKAAQVYEEARLPTEIADPELGEAGRLGINNFDKSGSLEGHLLYGNSEQKKAVKSAAKFHDESAVPNSPERHPFPEEFELEEAAKSEAGRLGTNNFDKSGSLEGHLLYGNSEQKKAVKSAAKFHDESAVPNSPERHPFPEEFELEEAAKSEENKAVESQPSCDNLTGANIIGKSHDISDVLTVSESHSLMGDFEPDEEENKDMELFGESNISTNVERHLLYVEAGLDKVNNIAATCEESFVFTSPERQQHLGTSEPHTAGKQERKEVEFKDESAFFTRLETRLLLGESGHDRLGNGESGSTQCQSHRAFSPKVILKDDSVVLESHVAAPDFRENTIGDFTVSTASEVSYSHEFCAGEETAGAEFMQEASQAENVVGLDAIQGTSKQSRENSPHVDSVNHFYFDTKGTDTIMDALPAKGSSETIGEIYNHIEVGGTCSLVSEESGPSTDIQNQIHETVEELTITDELIDAKNTQSDSEIIGLPAEADSKSIGSQLEVTGTYSMVSEKSSPSMDIQNQISDALEKELAVTDNNEANELIEAKEMKNVDSSVSGKTCVLARTDDEDLHYGSEVGSEDEATDPVDTAFEKDISLSPDESTLQKKEEAAHDEATPGPEETLKESSENIGESGTSSEKQVRREPVLFYRTQVKPKRHDMKENAPNSKIVDILNVTAPRTSKRQPLQDLGKN